MIATHRTVLAAAVVLIATPLAAVNLPQTGQTTCYNTSGVVIPCAGSGQDGEHQEGHAWPSPRFADHGDGTTSDQLTGLMWTTVTGSPGVFAYSCTPVAQQTLTWSQALALVGCLNSRMHAGHSDWRLPNVIELQSLFHAGQSDGESWLEAQGFTDLWSRYWSSTTHDSQDTPFDDSYAYTVSMLDGQVGIDWKESATYKYPAWPVRDTSNGPAALWRTGQTASWITGDDGYWQKGAAWPDQRFIVDGDCVHDQLTGLMWTKNADLGPGLVSWQSALDTVSSMSECGSGDWRLPNVVELRSLVHFGQPNLVTWLESQGFQNVQQDPTSPYYPYWSSTTREYQTNNAYGVRMDSSTLGAFMKDPAFGGMGYVWAVVGSSNNIFDDGFESGDLTAWGP